MSIKFAPMSDVKVAGAPESDKPFTDSIDAYAYRQALRIAELPPDLQRYLLERLRPDADDDEKSYHEFQRIQDFLNDMGVQVEASDES